MRIVWITRSFLDYRVPVYRHLFDCLRGQLVLLYNADVVPDRVRGKATVAMGENAVALLGEKRLGPREFASQPANRAMRVCWQPGILRRIRTHHPDVLVTDGFFQWTLPALMLRMWHGIPHVMCYERTAHTERNAQFPRRIFRRWAIRYVDAMCCNGRLCGEYARQLGMPGERITYGHMAADTDGLSAAVTKIEAQRIVELRRKLGVRDVCLLYVGKHVIPKGLRQLLTAWAQMDPQLRSKASLMLVGEGEDRPFLEKYCATNRLSNVHFVGAIDYDSLALYYASADAFVIPTLEDNWSLVVPEAMACGLPVLCSQYNGCWPELVHEGVNGWVFDPLKQESIVTALTTMLLGKSHLKQMGIQSRRIVGEHTPQRAAEAILSACHIAMNRSK